MLTIILLDGQFLNDFSFFLEGAMYFIDFFYIVYANFEIEIPDWITADNLCDSFPFMIFQFIISC